MSFDDRIRQGLLQSTAGLAVDADRIMDSIRHRSARQRERRWVTGGILAVVAAVLATAAMALSSSGWLASDSHPVIGPGPSISASDNTGPAEYFHGGKLIASIDRTDPHGVSLTFTPTSLNVGFMRGCTGDGSPLTWVNGRQVGRQPCLGLDFVGPANDWSQDNPIWHWTSDYGVKVGQPVTIRYAFPRQSAAPGTEWRIGVYQAVPPAQYQYPTRPSVRAELPSSWAPAPGRRLFMRGRPGSPLTFPKLLYRGPLTQGLVIEAASTEPVGVHLYINNRLAWTWHAWSWDLETGGSSLTLRSLHLRAGQAATITLRQDNLTSVTGGVAPSTYLALYDARP